MQLEFKLAIFFAFVTAISGSALLRGPSVSWKNSDGVLWGGDNNCNCEGEFNTTIGCIIDAGKVPMCLKAPNEELARGCGYYPCEKPNGAPDVQESYKCNIPYSRNYVTVETRNTVHSSEAVGTRPCYKSTSEGPEFCHCEVQSVSGSTKERVTEMPCWEVETCLTEQGDCVYDMDNDAYYCSPGTTSFTEPKNDVIPHPDFPCPTPEQIAEAKQQCEDTYGDD